MAVLETEPAGWGSWSARITSEGSLVAELKISFWKSRGHFEMEGGAFSVEPEGFLQREAALKRGDTVIARAKRASLFRRQWEISSAGHRLRLESRSWRGREFVLLVGGEQVGRVTREGMTGRRIRLEFPDEVPRVLQVFLVYLVLVQAKREAAAAASGS